MPPPTPPPPGGREGAPEGVRKASPTLLANMVGLGIMGILQWLMTLPFDGFGLISG